MRAALERCPICAGAASVPSGRRPSGARRMSGVRDAPRRRPSGAHAVREPYANGADRIVAKRGTRSVRTVLGRMTFLTISCMDLLATRRLNLQYSSASIHSRWSSYTSHNCRSVIPLKWYGCRFQVSRGCCRIDVHRTLFSHLRCIWWGGARGDVYKRGHRWPAEFRWQGLEPRTLPESPRTVLPTRWAPAVPPSP